MSEPDSILSRPTKADDAPSSTTGVPDRIGQVRLVRQLGRGGMGVVWLGRHELLQRDVAVKFLLRAIAGENDPNFALFVEGARAAAAVKHPGLTEIFDAGIADGVPYLVMEYVEGRTVADLLAHGPLSADAAAAVIAQTCEAVAELHDRGIVHRDIKPSNLLVAPDGRVVVTDFGLSCSRPIGQIGGRGGGGAAGTPAYMAPEMFASVTTSRTDVYALGVTAFEVLAGEPPFEGEFSAIRWAHAASPVPLDRLASRGVSEPIAGVVERAMNKDAMFRPKTARSVLDAWTSAVGREAVERGRRALMQCAAERKPGTEPAAAPSSSYYEQIGTMAAAKRAATPPPAAEPPPDPLNAEFAHPYTTPGASIQTPQTVAIDFECVECGYNLRGVPVASKCPECGVPVARTVHPGRLIFADAQWLRRLEKGWHVIAFSVLAMLLGNLGAVLLAGWWWGALLGFVLLAMGPALWLRGVHLATSAESGTDEPAASAKARRRARSGARIAFVCGLAWAVLLTMILREPLPDWTRIAVTPVLIVFAGSTHLFARHAGRIARRAHNPVAGRSLRRLVVVAWAMPALSLGAVLFLLLVNSVARRQGIGPGEAGPLEHIVIGGFGLALLFLGLAWNDVHARLIRVGWRARQGHLVRSEVVTPEEGSPPLCATDARHRPTLSPHVAPPAPAVYMLGTSSADIRTPSVVAVDLPCISCIYNLRGLPGAGVCPECGTPIEKTLDARRLFFADPEWLKRLEAGLILTGLGSIALILGPVASSFVISSRSGAIAFLAYSAAPVLWAAGIAAATWREPNADRAAAGARARKVARWGAAAVALGGLAFAGLMALVLVQPGPTWMDQAVSVTLLLVQVAFAVATHGFARCLALVAARASDGRAARSLRTLIIVGWAAPALSIATLGATLFDSRWGTESANQLVQEGRFVRAVLISCAAIALLALVVAWVSVSMRLGRTVRRAREGHLVRPHIVTPGT